MNLSFEETLIEVSRRALVENAKTVELGSERYPVRSTPKRGLAAGGFRVRRDRDSRAGAEPADEIPLGTVGTVWQESDASPQRGPLRGERSGWQGDSIRRARWNGSVRRSYDTR
jgi:hypothetical protein